MTEYLDLDTVLAINREHGGPGAGARDIEGIEAAINRPLASGFGQDLFPDVWSKAAAYLHGLCSTQYFHDGNKRTAWLVAATFLILNGRKLPDIPEVEAEAFILAVAKNLFSNEDEPDRTLKMAAEWFRGKWENRRAGAAIDPRVEYCFLAEGIQITQGTFNVKGAQIFQIAHTETYPLQYGFVVVYRFHRPSVDHPEIHRAVATIRPDGGKQVNNPIGRTEFDPVPPGGHAHHGGETMPLVFFVELAPVFLEDFNGAVELELDGQLVARMPLKVQRDTRPDV